MAKTTLAGYCDRFSAKPGERLDFMVSAEGATEAEVRLVRLIHGDENPDGPGFIERAVEAPTNGVHAVRTQHTQVGSFVRVADPEGRLAPSGPFTLWAFIWPRAPARGPQGLLTRWSVAERSGYALGIGAGGALEFRIGDGRAVAAVRAPVMLLPRQWYLVAASFDPASGAVTLYQEPVENRYANHLSKIVPLALCCHEEAALGVTPAAPAVDFLWAAAQGRDADRGDVATLLYDGKIDRCGVAGAVLDRARLDRLRRDGAPRPIPCSPPGTRPRAIPIPVSATASSIPAPTASTARAATGRCAP